MSPRALLLVLSLAAGAALAGCGGGSPARSTHPADGLSLASGKTVFDEHCSVCHSLNGRDNPRLQGGDLLGFHASRAEVVQFVREMPVVHRRLTSTELQAVVDYVMAAERSASGH